MAEEAQVLLLGPDPIIAPQALTLFSASRTAAASAAGN
jgi:hypothetical protein